MKIHIAAQPLTGFLVFQSVPFIDEELVFAAEQDLAILTWDTDEHEQMTIDLTPGSGQFEVITDAPAA